MDTWNPQIKDERPWPDSPLEVMRLGGWALAAIVILWLSVVLVFSLEAL